MHAANAHHGVRPPRSLSEAPFGALPASHCPHTKTCRPSSAPSPVPDVILRTNQSVSEQDVTSRSGTGAQPRSCGTDSVKTSRRVGAAHGRLIRSVAVAARSVETGAEGSPRASHRVDLGHDLLV